MNHPRFKKKKKKAYSNKHVKYLYFKSENVFGSTIKRHVLIYTSLHLRGTSGC